MNLKKQLAAGGALLAVTAAAACLKLAQWAGRQIEKAAEKVICRALRPTEKNKNGYRRSYFSFRERKILPRGNRELTFSPVEVIIIVHGTSTKNSFLYI